MAFLDPPYNVAVGSVMGRGAVKHDEFAMASGEMSRAAFIAFLNQTLGAAAKASVDGAVHYTCMDWRHFEELVVASRSVYGAMLNLITWVKTNAGQGSFYRSQHELIGVFRVGAAPHLNTIELGRHGRNRSNVWHYAGANTFRAGRLSDLRAHPTVKPVAMIAEAMKDCTRRNEIVLDTFCGSGTTILAAERVDEGRRDLNNPSTHMSTSPSAHGRRAGAGTPWTPHPASTFQGKRGWGRQKQLTGTCCCRQARQEPAAHDPQNALSIPAG